MRPTSRFLAAAALTALLAGVWPTVVQAQTFEADYQLVRPSAAGEPTHPFARVRVAPLVQSAAGFSGAGLSISTGSSWFGQVGMARSAAPQLPGYPRDNADVLNLGAGYRFTNGQSLSLQWSQGRGPGQRLGLAVNYDWPRYFVRFSYDQGANLLPQDKLRFSAGVRF